MKELYFVKGVSFFFQVVLVVLAEKQDLGKAVLVLPFGSQQFFRPRFLSELIVQE